MSSRAVPVAKMIAQVRDDPAMPIHWGLNKPGMQASAQLEGSELAMVRSLWMSAAKAAADLAHSMESWHAHKQVVNRILEPFQWMHTIVTATEWDNFFELRDHADAEPNIHALAIAMKKAMAHSQPTPRAMTPGAGFESSAQPWHLPFISLEERSTYETSPGMLYRMSGARCARVSYLNHDGSTPEVAKDLLLYERLVGGKPLHASPIEHQGFATTVLTSSDYGGNLVGWTQLRKLVERGLA